MNKDIGIKRCDKSGGHILAPNLGSDLPPSIHFLGISRHFQVVLKTLPPGSPLCHYWLFINEKRPAAVKKNTVMESLKRKLLEIPNWSTNNYIYIYAYTSYNLTWHITYKIPRWLQAKHYSTVTLISLYFCLPKKPRILWCLIFRWCHEKEIHEGIWSSVQLVDSLHRNRRLSLIAGLMKGETTAMWIPIF